MRLGIVSDNIHFVLPTGEVATENHILLRQLDALANYFDEVIICSPFVQFNEKKSYSTYTNPKFSFIQLPNRGGSGFKEKVKLLLTIPKWLKAFRQVDKQTDIVYQRFPNNLNIPGFFYFYFKQKKVFATYTGAWKNESNQSLTYKFQKWLLKSFFRGPVFVYTPEKKISKNIFGGFSPSYTLQEWNDETEQVNNRINFLNNNQLSSIKMITVGTLNENKNQIYILKTCLLLKQAAIPFHLYIVGEGKLKDDYAKFIKENNLINNVTITGGLTYTALHKLYRENDFVVQATLSEGFGKVPIEGFFHGLIPLLHQSTMAPYFINNQERGFMFDAFEAESLFKLINTIYYTIPAKLLSNKIEAGRIFVQTQTLENWANEYYTTVKEYFDL